MKRFVALLAGAAMILSALFLRGWLDDRGDASADDDGDDEQAGEAVLVCDTSLEEVCALLEEETDSLEVVIEDAATTRARLEAGSARPDDLGIDGWLTLDPLPGIVREQRERGGLPPILDEPADPIARSPLVLVGWTERTAVLSDACGGLDWRCVGDHAGEAWDSVGGDDAWGRVEPGIDDIQTDATALLVAGQAAAGFFATSDFASNDFDQSGFRAWWSDLLGAVPTFPVIRGTVLDQMLAAGPASYDLVGATEAHAVPTVGSSREEDRVTISYPSPVSTADVVLAPVIDAAGHDRIAGLIDDADLLDALSARGWRVAGEPLPPGADPDLELPAGNGLPRAGVLEALRRL